MSNDLEINNEATKLRGMSTEALVKMLAEGIIRSPMTDVSKIIAINLVLEERDVVLRKLSALITYKDTGIEKVVPVATF
jgi:hypothetical protein